MARHKVNFSISVPVTIYREGDAFIAYSPVLDLSTSGSTFELAKKRFTEATQVFVEELVEKGTLEEVLSDLGWEKVRRKWQPPVLVAQETETFDFSFVN